MMRSQATLLLVSMLLLSFELSDASTISGKVTSGGVGVSGFSVITEASGESCPSGTYVTDANGNYSFTLPSGWSGTVSCRPALSWKTPIPLSYNISGASNSTADFVVHGTSMWSDGSVTGGIPIDIESCDLTLNTGSYVQGSKTVASAPDGSGGTFIAWYAERGAPGSQRIYLQRISALGNVMWDARGIYLGESGMQDCGQPIIVADGSGGAYVVWTTPEPNRYIRIQHVTSAGSLYWNANAPDQGPYQIDDTVAYLWGTGEPTWIWQSLDAVSDGSGGITVAWIRSSFNVMRLRRILPDKSCGYQSGSCDPYFKEIKDQFGVPYSADQIKLLHDNASGCVLVWQEGTGGIGTDHRIYSCRVNSTGNDVFGAVRLFSADPGITVEFFEVCSDGTNGAIVCAALNLDVRAQKVSPTGSMLWGSNGSLVQGSELDAYGSKPDICSDGAGGAYITFNSGAASDIYAQHLQSASGTNDWGTTGIGVCTNAAVQRDIKVEKASDQKPIITWVDARSGGWDVFAEKLSNLGAAQWGTLGSGLAIANGAAQQTRPQIAPDQNGGAVFAWRHGESGKQHIFAMRRLLPQDIQAPTSVHFGNVALGTSSTQQVTISNSGESALNVTSMDLTAFFTWDSPGSSFQPVQIAPGGNFQCTLRFTPEFQGMHYGTLTIGSDDPDENPLTVNLQGKGFGYFPPGIAPTPVEPLPTVHALRQNGPNPMRAGAQTQIGFDLPVEENVRLDIFDLQGRKVQTLVDKRMPAGRHVATWDGYGAGGRAIPGVYFYRITTPTFESVGKLLMVP